MTYNEKIHAAQIIEENYSNYDYKEEVSLREWVKCDYNAAPEQYECINIQSEEDLNEVLAWMEN